MPLEVEPIPEVPNRYELTSKKLKAYETSLKKLNVSKNYKSSVLESSQTTSRRDYTMPEIDTFRLPRIRQEISSPEFNSDLARLRHSIALEEDKDEKIRL